MRVLFVHQNFPGQFRHVAAALAQRPGTAIGIVTDAANKQAMSGVPTVRYKFSVKAQPGMSASTATLLHRFGRAERAANAMAEFRRRGFTPDVIVGHPGWGELMLAPEIFPASRLIAHAEFYYRAEGADVGFDPEFPGADDALRVRLKAKNLPLLAALTDCTCAVAPTGWQALQCPIEFRPKIKTIHEGIRTDLVKPDATAVFTHASIGRSFDTTDEIFTFVNRNLEPMRGYHVFMRALPAIMAARPNAHVVIVGGDGVSYGSAPPRGTTWKQVYLDEVAGRLPMQRVHFVGQIPYASFVALMQITRLHIYATYPFVLSWSMLEAMSAGAVVLGSSTPPVTEMICDGRNGLLFDFFSPDQLAERAIEVLTAPQAYAAIRANARRSMVDAYDLGTRCLPAWLDIIDRVAQGPA